MAEQATIKYVGLPIDEVRPGMSIPSVFEPHSSYIDSSVYVNGLTGEAKTELAENDGVAAEMKDAMLKRSIFATNVKGMGLNYGQSVYATNVAGNGELYGLLPLASTPIKFAYFEMAVMKSLQAQAAGTEIPTITVDIEDAQDKLWWLQMAPNFVGSGFYITVAGQAFGADVVATEDGEEGEEAAPPDDQG